MESSRKKKLFDENGNLKPVKKKKAIGLDQFLKLLNDELGMTSKYDGYEHVCKTNKGKTCCWVNERKDFVSISIFPPFNEKWKTIRIYNKKDADKIIIMLKAKLNGNFEK
jgi:hypothetical protein